MADFVAVLRKTIDGLPDPTPELRQKVYQRARAAVAAKLEAIKPPPPQAAIDRQKQALEDAILQIEAEFQPALPPEPEPEPEIDDLEHIFASLGGDPQPAKAAPVPPAAMPRAPAEAPRPSPEARNWFGPADGPEAEDTGAEAASLAPPKPEPAVVRAPAPPARRKDRSGGIMRLAIAAVLLVALAGGGYAAWQNRDELAALFGQDAPTELAAGTSEEDASPAETAADLPDAEPEAEAEEAEQQAALNQPQEATEPEPAATSAPDAADAPAAEDERMPKFTQRLLPDGSEVDSGPAGEEPSLGEGTTVAAATSPAPAQPAAGEAGAQTAAPDAAAEDAEAQPAVAVGQQAIFYEERTSATQGSAEPGTIVWSVVQESPGADLPPEPAIRAEATIPGKDLQLRMTIRRNADQTLPASHIIEMIFLTPDDFEGGGIDNVLRMAMKATEEAAGSPLLGIPAKIADGFFLIALTDGPAEVEANMTLLRRQSWIDIPLVYRSGRRALMTMEKGIPGEQVFDEVMRAWQAASADAESAG